MRIRFTQQLYALILLSTLEQSLYPNLTNLYSRTCLERPTLLPSKSGLSRQVVSHNRSYKDQSETIRAYENGLSRRVVAQDRFYCIIILIKSVCRCSQSTGKSSCSIVSGDISNCSYRLSFLFLTRSHLCSA